MFPNKAAYRATVVVMPILLTSVLASNLVAQETTEIRAQVWADNWFALYTEDGLVKEDSVSIDTERSFNVEDFTFRVELPAKLSMVVKDYKEGDSGLEYIGSRRQKTGDGGLIAQFYNADTKELVDVTGSDWQCMAIHQAPLNMDCEKSSNPDQDCKARIIDPPQGWMSADFNDSAWPAAIEHSARDVRPHGEYDRYKWEPSAKIIWTEDLNIDNTLLCRFTLG